MSLTIIQTFYTYLPDGDWNLGAEINHYVERNNEVGLDWVTDINEATVLENVLAR